MNLEILVLGSGTSHGVPMIGCGCSVCGSSDPRDKRNRPSILVSSDGCNILIDTPPELRLSCLRFGVDHIESVVFTHHHADHIMGLDDIRRFNALKDGPMSCYGTALTLDEIKQTFRYAFGSHHYGGGLPILELEEISGPFCVESVPFEPLPVMHGPTPVTGFRIGGFAYMTDVKSIPDETLDRLMGLDTLILGVLRHRPHPTHLSVPEALELLQRIRPRQTFFTHVAHDMGHRETEAGLPPSVRLAYDGMRLELDV